MGIKTRIGIISDTHSAPLFPKLNDDFAYRADFPSVDVLIHCGDITDDGRISDMRSMITLMGSIKAELKLVIAGNHDFTLDEEYYLNRAAHYVPKNQYHPDRPQEVRELFEKNKAGITYLTEGTYSFQLRSGAVFTVYASPYTPEFCDGAFPYKRHQDRFNAREACAEEAECIAEHPVPGYPGVDIMITHGPPQGHLDQVGEGRTARRVGCEHLQRAVARARPRLHCFGHIHEARGAERVQWSDTTGSSRGNSSSAVASVQGRQAIETVERDANGRRQPTYVDVSQESGGSNSLQAGRETLMVNAAIMDRYTRPTQAPWIVDMDLPSG